MADPILVTESNTVLAVTEAGGSVAVEVVESPVVVSEIASGEGASYTLPAASATVLGGVKVGTGLSITDGVLSATGGSGTDAATVNSLIFAQTY